MLTTKQINTKITTFLRSDKKQRDTLQDLIVLTREHAKEHGDFTLLSKLISGLKANKSRNLKAITTYIQEFTTGIQWVTGDKYTGYKKQAGATVEFLELPMPWFEHKANAQVIAKVDVLSRAKSLMTTITKAIEEGNIKDGQQEDAESLKRALAAFTA
jgi:hypothetical protein